MGKIRQTIRALARIWRPPGTRLGDVLKNVGAHYIARRSWRGLWAVKMREGRLEIFPLDARGMVVTPSGAYRPSEDDLRAQDWFWDCYPEDMVDAGFAAGGREDGEW